MPETKYTKEDCVRALLLVLKARSCTLALIETLERLGFPPLTKAEEGAKMLMWMASIGELRRLKRLE